MGVYDVYGNSLIGEDEQELEDLLPNRLLVWHDEFDKHGIDRAKWKPVYGYRDSCGTFIYPEDADRNSSSGDGLSFYATKDHPLSNAVYSCPFLDTNNLFEFRYGRFEAKIKFPSVNAHHSTFWTLGANNERICTSESEPYDATRGVLFPSCGEIDVAEFDNGTVGARTHWSQTGFDTAGTSMQGGNIASLTSTPTDWHIYSCEWTETSVTFYVDGVQKGTWATSNGVVNGWNPFQHPHFLILNCVPYLNGTPSWDIAETQVAWVRVYAPVGVTEYIKETAISIPSSLSVSVGERSWLGTPTFTPENPSDMTIKWESFNEDICTCYGGMVIGVSSGTTFVKATSKHGCFALCKVTVS